jgi:hypothetical protein
MAEVELWLGAEAHRFEVPVECKRTPQAFPFHDHE